MTEEIRNDMKKLEILKQMNHMIPDIEKRQIKCSIPESSIPGAKISRYTEN